MRRLRNGFGEENGLAAFVELQRQRHSAAGAGTVTMQMRDHARPAIELNEPHPPRHVLSKIRITGDLDRSLGK